MRNIYRLVLVHDDCQAAHQSPGFVRKTKASADTTNTDLRSIRAGFYANGVAAGAFSSMIVFKYQFSCGRFEVAGYNYCDWKSTSRGRKNTNKIINMLTERSI